MPDVFEHGVRDDLCPEDIGLEEVVIVVNRARDVRLGGEVHDDVGLLDQRIDERRVADIPIPELHAAVVRLSAEPHRQVLKAARVREQIQNQNPAVRMGVVQVVDEVTADETRAAGHEECFHGMFHSTAWR